MIRATLLVAVLMSLGLAFAQDPTALSEAEVEARTESISKTLRCVVCQNQSIYDSNAPLAEDMRRLVTKRVEAGDSDNEVREYLRDRYGDYVLMSPPLQLNTLLLWLGPLFLALLGGLWFALRVHAGRAVSETPLSDDDRARVAAALSAKEADQ